jgi:quinoprotein relay system zinc metallohydrolase 1
MKRASSIAAFVLGVAFANTVALPAWGQSSAHAMPSPARPAPDLARLHYGLQARQIADRTWVLEGAVEDFSRANGCNIINTGFIATGDGVVVINTGPSRLYGEQQRQEIARVTKEPVVRVLNLNLHPDYFFGNQAWADRPVEALGGSMAGMQAEGANYATNLYRLCGDWMKGSDPTPARQAIAPQSLSLGSHRLELLRLDGHTGDDLVVVDHSTGVVFAGGLVFAERVPTTPHADVTRWLQSLDVLEQLLDRLPDYVVVPSHGPVHNDRRGIRQTRDWLQWVSGLMNESARLGLDLSEVLQTPVPEHFKGWAAQPAELHRTLTQWYPRFEVQALSQQSRVK